MELAYATTAHGARGETVRRAHAVIGEQTRAAAAYVGMTRGRERNVAHLIAENLDDAKRQWVDVFSRDRADLGPARAAVRAAEDIERYGPATRARPRHTRQPDPLLGGLSRRSSSVSPDHSIGL